MVVGTDRWLLNPRGWTSTRWDIMVATLLILTMITMPLTMAFKVADFFSNELVDCAGEGYVSRSDVDLHGISVSRGSW